MVMICFRPPPSTCHITTRTSPHLPFPSSQLAGELYPCEDHSTCYRRQPTHSKARERPRCHVSEMSEPRAFEHFFSIEASVMTHNTCMHVVSGTTRCFCCWRQPFLMMTAVLLLCLPHRSIYHLYR